MQYNANDTERADRPRELVEVITIALGTSVEVRRRFDQAWARGFEVASATEEGYRLRRQSDGAVLPVSFPPDDVRRSSGSPPIHLPR